MISEIINEHCLQELLQKSRIHLLEGYFGKTTQLFIKRDDELGFGIGGTKTRKYASLLKAIIEGKYNYTIIEGSLNSNNVLGLIPLLKSYKIPFKVAAPKAHIVNMGNAPWTNALLNPVDYIEVASTGGTSMADYAQLLNTKNIFVVKEGACQLESIPGLLSLALEIQEYEKKEMLNFKSIFIDSGTGISAISLLIGIKLLKSKAKLIITQIADTASYFEAKLNEVLVLFNRKFGTDIHIEKTDYELIKPCTAKSFGSVNSTIVAEWRVLMNTLQVPLDLTYTAKHFFTIKKYLEAQAFSNSLIINSGSWLAARNHSHLIT